MVDISNVVTSNVENIQPKIKAKNTNFSCFITFCYSHPEGHFLETFLLSYSSFFKHIFFYKVFFSIEFSFLFNIFYNLLNNTCCDLHMEGNCFLFFVMITFYKFLLPHIVSFYCYRTFTVFIITFLGVFIIIWYIFEKHRCLFMKFHNFYHVAFLSISF